jgi:outer membrane biogenesis lipoprotein LolB
VKTSRLIPFVVIPLLFACLPKRPEISLTEVPAGPLVQALEQRRESFSGLKAVAGVETVRSGRKRAYDTVGIILDGQRRLRVEAYGPLGQSLVTLLWDGTEMLLRLDDGRVVRPGPAGLERIFGMSIDAGELCAVLAGNIPATARPAEMRAFQEPDGGFMIEQAAGDTLRYFHVVFQKSGLEQRVWISASEVYRSGKLVYRSRYEQTEQISRYLIPKTVHIENPEKKVSFTVVFNETDVNVLLGDDAFKLPDAETGTQ